MCVSRLIAAAVLLLAAMLLAGCFSTSFPILETADGDPFPGGPGTLRLLDQDGKPQGRLVVSAAKGAGPGQKYRVRAESVADGRTKVEEGELTVKAVSDDRYLVQFKEDADKFLISPAVITTERFTIMVVDAETLAKIAEKHGLRTLQQTISGDNSEVERAMQSGEAVLVLTLDGPVVQASKEAALAIAMEMAVSDEAVPLEDGDYVRQAK